MGTEVRLIVRAEFDSLGFPPQGEDDTRGLPWERGLILVIFSVMDVETEKRALSQLKDILVSLLSLSCLSDWLSICKQVLADTSTE